MIQTLSSSNAPAAVGPYSQAVKAGGFVFLSGQIALDAKRGEMVGFSAAEQMEIVLENTKALLEDIGLSFDRVVKTTLYLTDMTQFAAVNEVYATAFSEHKPARACVEVRALPKDALVELECIALVNE